MKIKTIGYIIILISILIGFIIYSFNNALTEIVNTSCSHGPSCPMNTSITFQTNISIGIMFFVIFIGIYLIMYDSKKNKEIEFSKNKIKDIDTIKNLNENEKIILKEIIQANGTAFQSELIGLTNFSKVKISRILDKLEGKNIIIRRRHGMTNVVILNNETSFKH